MMPIMYYSRDGEPLGDVDEYIAYMNRIRRTGQDRDDMKRVAEDTVKGPDGHFYWVSTVWLGLNHQHQDGPPLIFETMVFPSDGNDVTNYSERYMDRYSTENQALYGHQDAVAAVRIGDIT